MMARMFGTREGRLHLLDAGAGIGMLSAAWTEELCRLPVPPSQATITAFEVDERLLEPLRDTLRECERRCAERGTTLHWTVRGEDFIRAAVDTIQSDCLAVPVSSPTLAILNPPYRKIASDSEARRMLRSVGIEATNLYSAFVSLAVRLLEPQGEIVAITPRSFCNGPYFRPFRRELLNAVALRRIHLFERRDTAFSDDDVLQENMIVHAIKGERGSEVVISQGNEPNDADWLTRSAPYDEVIEPHDHEFFLHLSLHDRSTQVADRVFSSGVALESLGLDVSTGRVVDFRSKQLLRSDSEPNSVPLIYPMHLRDGFVSWPKENARKPNALACGAGHLDLIVPNGTYVLVKRFTAKEEKRRIVAAVCAPARIPTSGPLAFENHLNYYHANGAGLPHAIALGLAGYLNTTVVDQHFREFSGHTQVNATDLRRLRYPPREALEDIGRQIGESFPMQGELDMLVERVLTRHYASECEAPLEISARSA